MSRPGMQRRASLAALLALAGLLSAGSEFRGCAGDERPPVGGTLPETSEGCLVDSDCVSEDMCVAVACVARECVEVGLGIDEDEDRYAPAPCGEDCDDTDPTVYPEATEVCDGVDQDCDEVIDEGATGIRTQTLDHGLRLAQIERLADGFVLVGLESNGVESQLSAQLVDAMGTAGAVTNVLGGLAAEIRDVRIDRTVAGILVVFAAGADQPPQRLLLSEGLSILEGPTPLGAEVGVTAMDVLVHSGTEHVVYDVEGTPPRRFLWRSGMMPLELTASTAPPALATDGALVAVTSGAGTVRFFDPVSGDPAGSQELIGGFAARGLADGDGVVYAVYQDAFDHAIVQVTPTEVGGPTNAPAGERSDDVEIFRAPPNVAVTRRDASGVAAWLLSEDLTMYVATFPAGEVSAIPGAPNRVSVATTDGGLSAILANYLDRSALALLSCGP